MEKTTAGKDTDRQVSGIPDPEINVSTGSSHIGTGLAGILFVLEIFALLRKAFSGYWPMLADFPVILDDASVFLNLMCIGWIVYAFLRRTGSSLLYFLYAVNLLLINHLYSNATWKSVYDFVKQNWMGAVWIAVIAAVVIGMIAVSFRPYYRNQKARQRTPSGGELRRSGESRSGVRTAGGENPGQVTSADYSTEAKSKSAGDTDAQSGDGNKINQSAGNSHGRNEENETQREKAPSDKNDDSADGNPFIKMAYFFGIFSLVLLIADFVIYDLLHLGFERPEILSANLSVIRMTGIILVAVAVSVIFANNFSANKIKGSTGATAIIAAGIEAVFLLMMNRITEWDPTSQFLNALTGNVFGIFLIVVITYMVIHIFLSIIMHLFFKNTESDEEKEIADLLKKNIYRLEGLMVKFSSDILLGILNLLCFIPSFFDTIGSTLLDKQDMFNSSIPEDKEKKK